MVDSTGRVLADALPGLAAVVRVPYHPGPERDPRDDAVDAAVGALDRLTQLLRAAEVPDDEGSFALGAVTVGVRRSRHVRDARIR